MMSRAWHVVVGAWHLGGTDKQGEWGCGTQ